MFRAAAEERVRGGVLPGVNTLVRITLSSSGDPDSPVVAREVASRVEDVLAGPAARAAGHARDLVWVALPRYDGDVEVPERGAACRVSWPTPVGLFELPTDFDGRERVGPVVRAWRLRVRGPALRAQRRRYVRVPWTGPVTVELPGSVSAPEPGGCNVPPAQLPPESGDPPEDGEAAAPRALAGTMVDLSEGGIRCLLPPPALAAGTRIRVVLAVAGQVLAPAAEVVWTRAATTGIGSFAETGVSFENPEEHGDLLRRVVFTEQLRTRRAGLA